MTVCLPQYFGRFHKRLKRHFQAIRHITETFLTLLNSPTQLKYLYDDFATAHVNYIQWWRHQREIFFALLATCAGNSPVSGEFPAQRPVTRSFDVFFDLRLNEGWVNYREAGDSRRNRAHYDVTILLLRNTGLLFTNTNEVLSPNLAISRSRVIWIRSRLMLWYLTRAVVHPMRLSNSRRIR